MPVLPCPNLAGVAPRALVAILTAAALAVATPATSAPAVSVGAAADVAPLTDEAALTYEAPEHHVTSVGGNGPTQAGVVTADLDGDGYPDLAALDSAGHAVTVLRNDGTGGFGLPERYVVGLLPYALTAADLDGDGDVDLAVANSRSDDTSVLINAGDGTFAAATSLPVGGLGPTDVAATDVDGDGHLDLLNYWGDVTVHLGKGDGTFTTAPDAVVGEPTGAVAIAMEVADLTGDGVVDIAVTYWPSGPSSSVVTQLTGQPDGTFTATVTHEVDGGTEAMRAGDVDCDGTNDLVVPVADGGLLVFPGVPDVGLGEPVLHETDSGSNAVALADLDLDGRLDLAVSYFNGYAGFISDICASPDWQIDPATADTVVTSEAFAVDDLDLDGRPDLVVGTWFHPQVAVLRSTVDVAWPGQVAGDDLVEVALAWSRARPDGSAGTVLLATTAGPADSLASGVLQGAHDAPLLLTPGDRLDPRVAVEVERLGADEAIVMGGPDAVGEAVVTELGDLVGSVRRVLGTTRVQTAMAAAEDAHPEGVPSTVLLARAFGEGSAGFADALGAGAVAAHNGTPVLLTPTDHLDPGLREWLLAAGVTRVVVAGGPAAVGEAVLDELRSVGVSVERRAGPGRSATAVAVRDLLDPLPPVVVQGGTDEAWAAGLTAALHADGGILLAEGDQLPEVTRLAIDAAGSARCGPTLGRVLCDAVESAAGG